MTNRYSADFNVRQARKEAREQYAFDLRYAQELEERVASEIRHRSLYGDYDYDPNYYDGCPDCAAIEGAGECAPCAKTHAEMDAEQDAEQAAEQAKLDALPLRDKVWHLWARGVERQHRSCPFNWIF